MRRLLIALFVAALPACAALAQAGADDDGEPKLTVPSSPAFSILNFEPAAVLRPATNKDLASDLLSTIDRDGKLLANAGLEVTPYWLQSRRTLTRDEYLKPTLGQLLKQSLSISAATVKDSATGGRKLGAGFRVKVRNGKPLAMLPALEQKLVTKLTIQAAVASAYTNARVDQIRNKDDALKALSDALSNPLIAPDPDDTAAIMAKARELAPDFDNTAAGAKALMDSLAQVQEIRYRPHIDSVVARAYERKGWIVEFAGASAFRATGGSGLERLGVWANASYSVSSHDLFSVTARYMYRRTDTSVVNADVGIGYLKQTGRYNLSLEALLRWYRAEIPVAAGGTIQEESDFSYRVAAQASYIVSRDISVNVSLGKDFNTPFVSTAGFFTLLGFNYSIFNRELVEYNNSKEPLR